MEISIRISPGHIILLMGLAFVVLPFRQSAQTNPPVPGQITHWLTEEEKTRLHETGLAFVETDPPLSPVRNVAEFDYMQGVLIRYPFGIPMSLIKEMAEDVVVTTIVANTGQQNTVIQQYVSNGVDTSNCDFLIAPTNSHWTRDYGPWFESDTANRIGIVDFPYNRPTRPLDDEIPKLLAEYMGIPWFGMNVIHTGGNYMTEGLGISASTTLVWEENPTQTHEQIAEKMHNYLGIETYQVVPDPNATYIDHIDCWGKFLAPDKILIRAVPPTHPRYQALENMAAYWAGQVCSYDYPYHVIRVNTPGDQPYTNSLILNRKVLMPFMNSMWDDSARAVYQNAMPGYEVIGFTGLGSAPWESTDALHCRAIGIADTGQLYIRHIPLYGNKPCEQNYLVEADIIACSHQPVKNDSVFIYYKVNSGNYQQILMTNTYDEHWEGYIPKQPAGSTVYYYLFAADASGRHATCPLIGPDDPFHFNTIYTNVTAVPDTLWFLTYENCLYGRITVLHNFTQWPILVNYIETEGGTTDFTWFVENPPSCPFSLAGGDSVSLPVIIPLPLIRNTDGFLHDTLTVITAVDTVEIIIMVNDSLLFTSTGRLTSMPDHLGNCYPNPFSEETVIPFTLTEPGQVTLEVISDNGKVVCTLVDETLSAGFGKAVWNGTDGSGRKAPGGVYLCRLVSERGIQVKRMVLIR
jgi:agmatine/peptidylarginine deiminase